MSLQLKNTECCAIQEIHHLGDHCGDGLGALKAFCQAAMPMVGDPQYARYMTDGCPRNVYTHYWFSEASNLDGSKAENRWNKADHAFYGKAFVDKIKELDLGTIIQSGSEPNFANHPDHRVVMYIWTPNREKLYLWWKENNKFAVEAKAAKEKAEAKAKQKAYEVELAARSKESQSVQNEDRAEQVAQDLEAEANTRVRAKKVAVRKRAVRVRPKAGDFIAVPTPEPLQNIAAYYNSQTGHYAMPLRFSLNENE